MSESTIHSLLRQSFPISNKADWLQAATAEIDGKDPAEILAWKLDGLTFSPYYDRTDAAQRQYLKNFELSPSPHLHAGARFWENLPQLVVTDEKKDNATLLHQLNNGADGILLDLRNRQTVDIAALLNQVDWPFCNVSFFVTDGSLENALAAYVQEKKYEPHSLSGTIWWNDLPQKKNPQAFIACAPHPFPALGHRSRRFLTRTRNCERLNKGSPVDGCAHGRRR